MHLPFCTNDLGHQDHLNVLPLHHSAPFFFILDNFWHVYCVTRTVPTALHTCRSYSFFGWGRDLWRQTSRNKQNLTEASGMGTKCSDQMENWMKLDKLKFVLVLVLFRSNDSSAAPPHGSLELRSQESARLALSRHVPVRVNVGKHCKQRSVGSITYSHIYIYMCVWFVVFPLGFCALGAVLPHPSKPRK